ncbi:hypothetical protein OEZ85_008965 [Tetradesmus obliquus]|uniref:Uncharacterized protein n=1 Tax=Tetradesmus obliquus TaxID=3088 RepID=A0ABY8TQ18_TETOB|nr:hypothetical protein OEZ85_008965 [Tetradesmus obliquus]
MIDTRKWEFHPLQLELHSPVHLQQMQLSQQQLRHQVLPQSHNWSSGFKATPPQTCPAQVLLQAMQACYSVLLLPLRQLLVPVAQLLRQTPRGMTSGLSLNAC